MGVFSCEGLGGATVATANHVVAGFWNPASAQRIHLLEMGFFRQGGAGQLRLPVVQRISTQGTPGTTITPDADNAWDDDAVPPSGALLGLAPYSVQPTLQSPPLMGYETSNSTGALGNGCTLIWPDDGLAIAPGSGVAFVQISATINEACVTYAIWEEGRSA